MVQAVKQGVKAGIKKGANLKCALQAFLFRYRKTPHATTGAPPCIFMLGQELRTRLQATCERAG